ncbi:FAD-dependent oxidoreductase [Streptomyces rubellomurinus]|uniref:Pentachlorophenol monooxygenase n=1 Tax=Streptomyces rubellomurinus (strain ATCC 31215) TaxID=359131 RepID=A0A0F2T6L1_STRR3|nr:FAD-dependent oxidoreductase [Streptomyces rubellomurinus]KJS57940.1 pentachlorophenol monooxygenase [Streptomyces rubellomurinus]
MLVDTPAHTDVLIVGAGPTGLALAIDLARRGTDALLVERAPALSPGSRGKGLQPRTLEVLEDLGALEAVRAHAAPYPPLQLWNGGRPQREQRMFDAIEPTQAQPYTQPLMLPQWRTQQLLHERLRALGGRVAFGHELTALAQDEHGVSAEFTGGHRVRARYLVAADGGRSTVRTLLGIGMSGQDVDPQPMVVADMTVNGLDREHWHVFPPTDDQAGGATLALCPLPGGQDFQLLARHPGAREIDLTLEGLRATVTAHTHLHADQIEAVHWASTFRARTALADRFRDRRVLLAGDAAHLHSPAGGQGLNTSIQDAYNLGWKLDAVLTGTAHTSLLDTYEEERRPNAAAMLELTTAVHHGKARRGRATAQLDLGYRQSPLSVETRPDLPEDALHAGDRAPDGHHAGTRLFHTLHGPHWTLLTVNTDTELPDAACPVLRIPTHQAYGTGVFLIRPDGYIGWAGHTTHGLTTYATRHGAPIG